MKWIEYTRKFLAPEIVLPFFYLVFLLFAFVSYNIEATSRFLSKPRAISYALSFLGIFVFILFARLGRKIDIKNQNLVLAMIFFAGYLALDSALSMGFITKVAISGGYALLIFYSSKRVGEIKILTRISLFLAILISMLGFFNGIPIIDVFSRGEVSLSIPRASYGFSVFAAAMLVAFYSRRFIIFVILLVFLGIASGFKSDAIGIILSATITGLLVKEPKSRDVFAILLGVILVLTAVGTYIASRTYGVWGVPPALYMFYRAGFTFSVFDKIISMSLPFGITFGKALMNPSSEIMSTVVLGYDKPTLITSTLLGPSTLDFGVFGLLFVAATLGIYLGKMYAMAKKPIQICLYAIALAHALILIEIGLQLVGFLFFLSLLYLSISAKD